jgi:hypothetical protein
MVIARCRMMMMSDERMTVGMRMDGGVYLRIIDSLVSRARLKTADGAL